jgi:recombination protein RecT
MTQPATALQKFDSVAKLLQSEKVQNAIARALPRHITPERMIRVAMTALQKTPSLAECEQRSLISSIIQASELGLEPNTPLQQCYLIPFYNKNTKRKEAQLMIGYRGMISLARRSNQISGIYAEIVYEHDFFEITYGLDKNLVHKPDLNLEDRGKKIGVYAVAKFKDGYTDFEYMNAAEVAKIRKRSQSGDSGPWVTDEGEMWRKTPIRRLWKRLPQSIEDVTLQKAIEIDTGFDTSFDADITPLELGEGEAPEVISEEQRVALVDAAKESGADLTAIVNAVGFEMLAHITVDQYDAILDTVKAWQPTPAAESDATPDVTVADAQDADVKAAEPTVEAKPDSTKAEHEDLIEQATTVYNTLDENAKLEADKFLSPLAIKDLTTPKLRSFLKQFGPK